MNAVTPLPLPEPTAEDRQAAEPAVVETPDLRACARLARAVMDSRTRIGRILGDPGTGKTEASRYLAATIPGAVRLCCRRGMSESALSRAVAGALGLDLRGGLSTDDVLDRAASVAAGRLVILDEANHLKWQHLERLRWLPDEAGAGLLLIGTDLLSRTFQDGRNAVYLAQLARRIGTKQVRMGPMDAKQTAAYLLQPRFGRVDAGTARAFHKAARGYWGQSTELADGCARVMAANSLDALSEAVVASAVASMADGGRR